jgi:hypothetical protein
MVEAALTNYDFIKPTPRKNISNREREEIFLREKGICHFCDLKIFPGQKWDVSHPETGLWAGGSDDRSVLKPAHHKCHKDFTDKVEAPQRAKERRIRQKHIGAFKKSGPPMPGSRRSKYKKKMNRKVELR